MKWKNSITIFIWLLISEDIKRQQSYAIEIWKKWRSYFNKEMATKKIIIEICDSGTEITIYLFEHQQSI